MVDVYAPRTREEVTVQLAYLVLWLRSLIIRFQAYFSALHTVFLSIPQIQHQNHGQILEFQPLSISCERQLMKQVKVGKPNEVGKN